MARPQRVVQLAVRLEVSLFQHEDMVGTAQGRAPVGDLETGCAVIRASVGADKFCAFRAM
jgi:hypothetical protein